MKRILIFTISAVLALGMFSCKDFDPSKTKRGADNVTLLLLKQCRIQLE